MTGFEVERGGRRGEPACWVRACIRKKKSESEDGCGPISPPGFWIINKDKEDDYQVLTVYFVWISPCLWRGSEALAIRALWRLSCWREDLSGTPVTFPWDDRDEPKAARAQRIAVRGHGSALGNQCTTNTPIKREVTPVTIQLFRKHPDLRRSKGKP